MKKQQVFVYTIILCISCFVNICKAQENYKIEIQMFPYEDGLVYRIELDDIRKFSFVKMMIYKSPWPISTEVFIDSLKLASTNGVEIDKKVLSNKDFRIRMIIRHKYLFFIKYTVYCDRFGYIIYDGRMFYNDMIFKYIFECVPPFIN